MTYSCRACAAPLQMPVVELPRMPLTDDFVSAQHPERKEYLSDIQIFECGQCGLVQNPADFDHETYYQDYQYSSGHSAFVQQFMLRYATVACEAFRDANGRWPESVLEIGSGDGEQLKQFKQLGVADVLGVEPSDYLARAAEAAGIPTEVALFDSATRARVARNFDVCISSYTFDHVRSPIDYLRTAHAMLRESGVLAFEVHNLEKIIERTEYCLFEHEHTIYLTPANAGRLLQSLGFEVISTNPLPSNAVRGNSLIVLARKVAVPSTAVAQAPFAGTPGLGQLGGRIRETVARLDGWARGLPPQATLVGFGAGGRGVMTLAAMSSADRFAALFDSNYPSGRYLTPKTRIPIVGPDGWHAYRHAHCLVYSFGYMDEIRKQLVEVGFDAGRIVSLTEFFPADGA